ncbi:polysaccharide deacetylase family protein [Thalassotalea sp. M1531]|uniref:Polysaccharide deacetylase family protein n=1 Tax=Thalassotalea algicola TaxID=2716224 RepID=A0A7Y0LEZ6_9GAMM|nr:polysaccharide deacetylase family protein [Thalassotalea algicola]NMP33053.1 polysaccharide deacetylase family protein [Thalassotalea algicola]
MLHSICKLLGRLGSKNKLSILIYHQVLEQAEPMHPSEPDKVRFRWQMKLLRDHYNPLSLSQATRLLKEGNLPANSVCVTFDDGYLNNLEVALPILKEFDIPATVFVATRFSEGGNMWNDRLIDLVGNQTLSTIDLSVLNLSIENLGNWQARNQLVKKLIPMIKHKDYQERQRIVDRLYKANHVEESPAKMMTPAQVKELAEAGVEIGAHTVDHPILKSQTVNEQKQQIEESKQTIEEWIGQSVAGFAYPNGQPNNDYTEETVEQVKQASYNYAVSTRWGISTPESDMLQLNRFTPWDRTPTKFHLRLTRNQLGI